MGSEWAEFTVSDLIKEGAIEKPLDGNHGGIHPKSSDYVSEGIPFVMASDMIGGRVDTTNCKFISKEQAEKLRKGFAKEGDVLLSHKATIGRTAIVEETDDDYIMLTPQVTYYRVADQNRLHNGYLRYYFDSAPFQELFNQWAGGGSTRAYLGITGQLKLPIVVPPLPEQKAIAHILGTLDDKIELNRRMNATLEGMAQALFKSWFVDFDPVIDNALAAGNRIPDELAPRAEVRKKTLASGTTQQGSVDHPTLSDPKSLFPAAFQFTDELGWIPESWTISKLKDCTTKIGSGSTPRGGGSAYVGSGTRLVRSQNIHDSSFTWSGMVCITDEAAEKLKGVTLTDRDVLINITGDSILRTCIVDPAVLPARVNQHVAILRPTENLPPNICISI